MYDLLTGAAGLTNVFFIFLVFLDILWTLLPFAIFGIKKRLDEQIKIGIGKDCPGSILKIL